MFLDPVLFLLQDGTRFLSIGGLHSELVAVSCKGELYQWRWAEPEPYRNSQVRPIKCAYGVHNVHGGKFTLESILAVNFLLSLLPRILHYTTPVLPSWA